MPVLEASRNEKKNKIKRRRERSRNFNEDGTMNSRDHLLQSVSHKPEKLLRTYVARMVLVCYKKMIKAMIKLIYFTQMLFLKPCHHKRRTALHGKLPETCIKQPQIYFNISPCHYKLGSFRKLDSASSKRVFCCK